MSGATEGSIADRYAPFIPYGAASPPQNLDSWDKEWAVMWLSRADAVRRFDRWVRVRMVSHHTSAVLLDTEWKLRADGRLAIEQIRPLVD